MEKTCKQCAAGFEITDEDLAFYDAVSPVIAEKKYPLPPPTSCPSCRYRQRLTWRNERNLYKRTCSATGKPIVSIWSPEKKSPPVYEQAYWWSDKWDARTYGRDVDFSRPFFEQWSELFHATPQIAMNNQMSENCEFTNQSQENKDCYMIFCSNRSRDCIHGMWLNICINCVDCTYLENSELCYQMLNGRNCYHCMFSRNLENCSDVLFSKNCIGCKNCFGCVNLRNKEYFFMNEKCTEEEYQSRISALQLTTQSDITDAAVKAEAFFRQFASKYYNGANGENFSGDYFMNVKNTLNCFNCRNTENLQHCQDVWRARNCQDMTETVENDFCYSLEGSGYSVKTIFSKKFCNLNDSAYCSHCNFSKNLFGCISLNNAQYCILNKQYAKEEYEALVGKILEYMKQNGEWGEHFPAEFSPYGYNETVAQEYFPLSEEEALKQGYAWRRHDDDTSAATKIIPASALPDSMNDTPDDVMNWAIQCEATGRPFRIIRQELDFYKRMALPIPHVHSDERYRRRMALRNPRKLWDRECMKCLKSIQTTFAPGSPEIVCCEECYLKEVY